MASFSNSAVFHFQLISSLVVQNSTAFEGEIYKLGSWLLEDLRVYSADLYQFYSEAISDITISFFLFIYISVSLGFAQKVPNTVFEVLCSSLHPKEMLRFLCS